MKKLQKSGLNTIRSRLYRCMSQDKPALLRDLRQIEKALKTASDQSAVEGMLDRLDRRLGDSIARREKRKARLPRLVYPGELPICGRKDEIVAAIRRHQVVVISGETGSGKSTQIPKMCLEAGRGIGGLIGHTQPRRIAAMTIARRISEELGETVGGAVGYQIRFEEKTGPNTHIKVMTDGILLAEVQTDPFLNAYDTIIVDEAHERSLNIDFLLGILRNLLKQRRDLKLVITSATLDTRKFSEAFGGAPVIEVSGRLYPVEVRYRPIDPDREASEDMTYVDAAILAVEEIERELPAGDILIFMPTEQDIRETCAALEGRSKKRADADTVLPLFARLTWPEQRRIFAPAPFRKIIVATNVAETSLTIPGIRYVIDTGLARIARYNSRTRTLGLPVAEISRSSADQRKGRCGRVEAGVCFRLYDRSDYEARELFTVPEILRSNLAEVILRMLSLKIGDIESFPFIDPPDPRNIRTGLEVLKELGAVQAAAEDPAQGRTANGSLFALTELGRKMARLPMDPRISRMIIEAQKEGCVREVAVIASALSIQDPREWPLDQIEAARKAHEIFQDHYSDFLGYLNIWNRYHECRKDLKSQNRIRKFCKAHFISYKRMREWIDVHDQLTAILSESYEKPDRTDPRPYAGIHKSILSGYLSNIAVRKEKNLYAAARGREVMLFPGSCLFNKGGEWIVAAEMVETTKLYARTAAIIDLEWIEPPAKDLCRYTYSSPHWERKRGEVVATEQVALFGLVVVTGRPVSYGRIAPEEASDIFIRSALIEGDLERQPRFLAANSALIETISGIEDKLRRRDLLVDDEVLFAFYKERLGGIFDIRTLMKRIRLAGGDSFLKLTEEDLMRREPDESELALFPDKMSFGKLPFPLHYRFNPGADDDGITVKIPHGLVAAVSPESAEWLIPGLQREKITCLVKALPKEYRKRLVPVATSIDIIMKEMPGGDGPLASALSDFILKRFGIQIPARAWPLQELPDFLKMRFSVTDAEGREIRSGRDIGALQRELSGEVKTLALDRAKQTWERNNVTAWDFGDLPESIVLEGADGAEGLAYPALVVDADHAADDQGRRVNIRLFQNGQEALNAHRAGVRTLFARYFAKNLKYLKKQPPPKGNWKLWTGYFGGEKAVESALYERTLRKLFPYCVRTEREFRKHAEEADGTILIRAMEAAQEVATALKAYAETRLAIWKMENAERGNKTALAYLRELRESMDRLLPGCFIEEYENERLVHIPRYLKALEVRAEKGLIHLEKDRQKAAHADIYETMYRELKQSITPQSSDERRKAVDDFRWMVEEYKIAVFAQRIKTAVPVSPKRLEERYGEIERMI